MVLRATLVFFYLALVSCSSMDDVDTSTPEGAFDLAKKYEKDERYEEAVTFYSEVKNKHPYSRLATEAELKVADIQYRRENFVEAESAYRLFREFHPDHPKADYVTFRTGMAIYKQLPPTIDRDLALAADAVRYFEEVLTTYPASPLVDRSEKYKQRSREMLAEKEMYIAEFYFKRKKYESALGRYEDVLQNYPKLGFNLGALYGATVSSYRIQEKDKAKQYFRRLVAEHPSSKELDQARKELADGF